MNCLENLKIIADKLHDNNDDIEEAAEELFKELEAMQNGNNGELVNNYNFDEIDVLNWEERIDTSNDQMSVD